jgi:hypothetical protein
MINRQAPIANLAMLEVTKQANCRQGAHDSTSLHCSFLSNRAAHQRMNDFARTYNTPYILNTNCTALSANFVPVLALIVFMTWPHSSYYVPVLFQSFLPVDPVIL